MTAADILTRARSSGIVLEAHGDRLVVDAPRGAITDEWRSELTRHKPAILALLSPITFVPLKNGPIVPLAALQLAWSLENRGFQMMLDASEQFTIQPASALTDTDRAAIRRWRLHLGAIIRYQAPELM